MSGTTLVNTLKPCLHKQIMEAKIAYGWKERHFGRDGKPHYDQISL